MRKNIFLLGAVMLFSVGLVNGQNVLKYDSFNFHKGLVMSVDGEYEYCTFMITAKGQADVQVGSVYVDGVKTEFMVSPVGRNSFYTVKIPKFSGKVLKEGEFFDLKIIFVVDGGFMISAAAEEGDPSDGGPGNTSDPTVIVIKYP